MAFGILAWFYGYYNRKSNDNLPSLSLIAEMEEADANELLVGYRKIQLREVWNEPDETSSNEDVWIINERISLVVSYNNKDKVVVCSLSNKIPSLEEIVENGAEWGNEQLQQAQGCTLADLEKAWGKADGELSGMYGYFWKVGDTVSVTVLYYKDVEVEHITHIAVTERED